MRQLENVSFFHFLELQSLFEAFFQKNILSFLGQDQRDKVKFFNSNFSLFRYNSKVKYNLIISNPPILKKVRID